MKKALLLNYNGEPLHFIDGIRAIKLILKGRVEVASGMTGEPSFWEDVVASPSCGFKLPAVIRLKYYVNKRACKRPPRFQKWVLFNRDAWTCQYCGVSLHYPAITIDHVQPISRGGLTSWKNCVVACKKCNGVKGNKTLEESGMKLLKQPSDPTPFHYWDTIKSSNWHQDWTLFVTNGSLS